MSKKPTEQEKLLSSSVFNNFFHRTGVVPPEVDDSYGIEIEMEGVGGDGGERFLNIKKDFPWRAVADGSLRDGIEFISNGPRPYESLPSDIEVLHNYLESVKFTPVFSYRTSVHVHMNAMHMGIKDIFTLFVLYTIFEAPMIDFGGEERCGNVHCLPVSHAQNVIDLARNTCYNDVSADDPYDGVPPIWRNSWRALISRDRRYASFNWAALPDKGTIEFRTHRGTMDQTELMNWVNIIHSLKQAALKIGSPAKAVQMVSSLGLQQFADDIFGDLVPEFAQGCMAFEHEMWEGIRLAQHVAFSRAEWPELIVKKEKATKKGAEPAMTLAEVADNMFPPGQHNGVEIRAQPADGVRQWFFDAPALAPQARTQAEIDAIRQREADAMRTFAEMQRRMARRNQQQANQFPPIIGDDL